MAAGKRISDPLAYCRRKQTRLAREKIADLGRRIAAAESVVVPHRNRRYRLKAVSIMRRHLAMLETFLHRGW